LVERTGSEGSGGPRPLVRADGRNRPVVGIADTSETVHDGSVKPRRVVILAFPGVQPLDVVGPAEVFSGASQIAPGAYAVEVVAGEREPILAHGSSYGIVPAAATAACRGPIDTLMVAGGFGVHDALKDASLVAWVRAAASRSRRITSVCSGALLLAAAGLLDGRRVTTHWASCHELERRHPEVDVDPKPIFVSDGEVWTSAGVTAGIVLALALVEDDLGPEVPREVARWLVVFLQRPGGQAQFSSYLASAPASRDPLRELQAWMADNLDDDLRVEALAARAAMSPRNFARAFRRETGLTPAAYVEALRVEAARQRLELGSEPVDLVAERAGFGTPETMRRAFARRVGVAPAEYRARFKRAPDQAA
jgi:transcriptional regulator GlxA family with amidase domain